MIECRQAVEVERSAISDNLRGKDSPREVLLRLVLLLGMCHTRLYRSPVYVATWFPNGAAPGEALQS